MLALVIGIAAAAGQPPFSGDAHTLAAQNDDFRRVLFTGPHTQLVAMALPPGEDIGAEVHATVDQCFFVESGRGEATVAGKTAALDEHSVVCVPSGTKHDVRNTGDAPLKLLTTYSPPQHPPGTVHHTKADAMKDEE
jgi:mannose-6-phosphate isomerase-like protein (cupin superfamily)